MNLTPSQTARDWVGQASTSKVPPPAYWEGLAAALPDLRLQIEKLHHLSDNRLKEFKPSDLPFSERDATKLLDRVVADGWLKREQRQSCPSCEQVLDENEASQPVCPNCQNEYRRRGGVIVQTVYTRELMQSRSVDWVIAIHGMNTTGAWQESFSWLLGTTWGKSVPVEVYKYGFVIAGVVMAWRRRKLQNDLREKLARIRDEARAKGFSGKPDVVAHSFGTWLFGHLLQDEIKQNPENQLKFGRIILTGCVLRPDFDWEAVKRIGLVEDVLNHYGTKDQIVPLAHATIWDSGPSGRRGFDGNHVLNLRAEGYGHSDLFSIENFVINDVPFQNCLSNEPKVTHLAYSYERYWRRFLTLPGDELRQNLDCEGPSKPWHQLPWGLRGTIFPFVALPFIVALLALLIAIVGKCLWKVIELLTLVIGISASGLVVLATVGIVTWIWRRLRM